MRDHTRIEREVTSQLRERAASAQPSPDAWERFVAARKDRGGPTGAAAEEPSPEPARGPYLSTNDRHLTTKRSNGLTRNGWMAGVVAVAAVALVVVGIVVASGDDETPVTTGRDPAVADGGGDGEGASLVLTGDECTYEGPTELAEGPLVVSVENQSDSDANFAIYSLGPDEDILLGPAVEEKRATIEQEGEASADLGLGAATALTARADVPPGESAELTAITPVGNYGLVCTKFEGGIPKEVTSPLTFIAEPAVVEVTG